MKTISKLGFASLLILQAHAVVSAEDISLYLIESKDKPTTEIPVTGDYDESSKELALKFSESSTYNVDVYSEKGLIYSARVTVDTYEEVRIAVRGYADEAFTVVVTDSKGHRYQGDFFA